MSSRWPAGVIRKTPVTPAGPYQDSAASGVWTLAEATFWQKQGLWPIAGNFLAVEDVFSTYLYTGNGSTQTITNGLNVSGQGGMVWIKSRSAATNHFLFDTTRGVNAEMNSNTTDASASLANSVTAFNSTGFALGSAAGVNTNADTYVSWTFRETPKFFDVVTYTGTGSARTIAHNLGIAPGMMIIKRTSNADAWYVWHRSLASNSDYMQLQSTGAANPGGSSLFNNTAPTASVFSVGTDPGTNGNGDTYVAYLFAHNATADGIIQCGSFTTDASGNAPPVDLGWEPQWILWKSSSATGNWQLLDTMRGWNNSGTNDNKGLYADLTNAEGNVFQGAGPNPTGFTMIGNPSRTYIYIAIRRGPMKTPTVGTSVFAPATRTGTGTTAVISSTTFPPDLLVTKPRTGADPAVWFDRLRGRALSLTSNSTTADTTTTTTTNDLVSFNMNGITVGANQQQAVNSSGVAIVDWNFRRAPGFFDEVCYTGTASLGTGTWNHNLGVVPELIIYKSRSSAIGWYVYAASVGVGSYLTLNSNNAAASFSLTNNRTPTSTVFYTTASDGSNNGSGTNYVAYLFASCPGVSKVGSYTGNGSSQTINCGFSSGARFFLVKASSASGDWWVWDSARGITAPADPALTLNSAAAEVTSADATDPDNSGIIVNQEATCSINANGVTYIFLAIA